MLGIIFGAAGMVFVYYTVQTIFGPVDEEFYLGYYILVLELHFFAY